MATASGRQVSKRAKTPRHAGGAPRRNPSSQVGVVLERAAEAVGLHLDEVAQKAGLTFQAVNDIRRGKTKNPSGMTLARLAKVLRISVERLTSAL